MSGFDRQKLDYGGGRAIIIIVGKESGYRPVILNFFANDGSQFGPIGRITSHSKKERIMNSEFAWLESIAPDMVAMVTKRYQILQYVSWMEPVGRRSLADQMHVSERIMRTDIDFLRQQGLLDSSKSGVVMTARGRDVWINS